jgi:hypothetical protein
LPSPEAFTKYKVEIGHYVAFLRSMGFDHTYLAKNPSRNIVFVDRLESGKSMTTFGILMQKALACSDVSRFRVLGLVNPGMSFARGAISLRLIELPLTVLGQISNKHKVSQGYSLGFPFPPGQWPRWRDAECMREIIGPPALARRGQIHEHAATILAADKGVSSDTSSGAVGAGAGRV